MSYESYSLFKQFSDSYVSHLCIMLLVTILLKNSSRDTDDHKVKAVLQVLIWWEVVEIEVEEGSINRF